MTNFDKKYIRANKAPESPDYDATIVGGTIKEAALKGTDMQNMTHIIMVGFLNTGRLFLEDYILISLNDIKLPIAVTAHQPDLIPRLFEDTLSSLNDDSDSIS